MNNETPDKYGILRQLAMAGSHGADIRQTAEVALQQAAQLVGLKAAAMFLWDDKREITVSASYAQSEAAGEKLESLETNLFAHLRKEQKLLAAYMTFDGEPPLQSFTHPIRYLSKTMGAVIGIQESSSKLIAEDLFIEALSAAISLNALAMEIGKSQAASIDQINKERLGAVQQTAVTMNHEINNPLTAILGNVQLVLMKRQDLDEDLVAKLKTIEISALKIRDVTQKLLRLTSVRSVDYTEGTSMLDLSDESDT